MSEVNGAIRGTSIGSPGHPAGKHLNGFDIDLAYYQTGTADNKLRGSAVYLDTWRTALFLGSVFESTKTRVIGVDGKAGPKLMSALNQLCTNGWLTQAACNNISLAYETTNTGQGWYLHHHHHAHISTEAASFTQSVLGCENPFDCDPTVRSIPKRPTVHRLVPVK